MSFDAEQFCASEIKLCLDCPILYTGQCISMPVQVTKNTDVPWPIQGEKSVKFSYHWLDQQRRTVVWDGIRSALPGDIGTGETLLLSGTILAPAIAGEYVLQATLVYEQVCWFESASPLFRPCEICLKVAEAPSIEKSEALQRTFAIASERFFYENWISRYDTLTPDIIGQIQEQIASWPQKPLISVIMPVYNTAAEFLREAIESVRQQIYPTWELCIADDASTQPYVHEILKDYARKDSRIKVTFRSQNGHISAASNTALEMAQGEYVFFLDHDDVIAGHTLYFVAGEIVINPEVDWIYFDMDHLDDQGKRSHPVFKPDYDYSQFLSHNFMDTHAVYRTRLVREVGGLRKGYEGSQDYDLGLRMVEIVAKKRVVHIPHIMYRWRRHPLSASAGTHVKPYTKAATRKALEDHLRRCNINATVQIPHIGNYRVQYRLPENPPLVSIIIPTRNGKNFLSICIASILDRTSYRNYELFVVDNQSDNPDTLDYLSYLESQSLAKILRYPHPFNYSAIYNMAVKQTRGEILCFLHSDTEVIKEGWLTEMVSQALRPEIGIVGACLWKEDNRLQHGGIGLTPINTYHVYYDTPRSQIKGVVLLRGVYSPSAVSGACMVMRREVFYKAREMAECLPVVLNDIELCLRVLDLGLSNVWTSYAELYHYEQGTRKRNDPEYFRKASLSLEYLRSHYYSYLKHDPAFNPNLNYGGHFDPKLPPGVTIRKMWRKYHFSRSFKLAFLHIPKTAGISLRDIVQREYPWNGAGTLYAKELMLCYERDIKAIQGAKDHLFHAQAFMSHFTFGIHEILGMPCSYITFLRHPVQRVISHYTHLTRSILQGTKLITWTLKEMIEKQIIPSNWMTRMLYGERPEEITWAELDRGPLSLWGNVCGFHLPPDVWRGDYDKVKALPIRPPQETQDILQQAIDNIHCHFYFVGLTERLSEGVAVLGQNLGWDKYSHIPELNVARGPKLNCDTETIALIEKYNQLDIRLYEYIRNMPGGYFLG